MLIMIVMSQVHHLTVEGEFSMELLGMLLDCRIWRNAEPPVVLVYFRMGDFPFNLTIRLKNK